MEFRRLPAGNSFCSRIKIDLQEEVGESGCLYPGWTPTKPNKAIGHINLLHFQLRPLDFFNRQDFRRFVGKGFTDVAQIAGESPHSVRFQAGGVVGALPGAIEGEVAFEDLGTEGEGTDVCGDPEMVAAETDLLDAGAIGFAEAGDLQQADIFEGDGIAGGAAIEHQILVPPVFLEALDDGLFLGMGCHADGEMDLPAVVSAEIIENLAIEVGGGGDLDELRIEGNNFAGGGHIPDGSGVDQAKLFAPLFKLAVLFKIQLKCLAMGAIRITVGIGRIWMGCVVLLGTQEFLGMALLEFHGIHLAEQSSDGDELLGDGHVALVVTADFGD